MRNFILFFLSFVAMINAQVTTSPNPVLAESPVTLTLDTTGTGLASATGTIYAHMGVTVDGAQWQNVIGSWGNNTTQPALTSIGGNLYELEISPDLYTYFGVATTSTITEINVVFRNAAGNAQTSPDIHIPVGAFQVDLTNPEENSTTFLNSGQSLSISATNSGGNADYSLMANGVEIDAASGVSSYSYTHTNITSTTFYSLIITQGSETITKSFSVLINPGDQSEAMPGGMNDGINYNESDATQATLVLNAPGKDYVYVAGSFNDYQPTDAYAMKKDPATGKYWLTLTGLTAGQVETYQYWVVDETPFTNSPALVKTADPFSTMVLSPFDDPYIPSTSYPNLPEYPEGQEREVTVLQTAQTPYNWQVTDFVHPPKEDLVIYELLIRDFTEERTYQSLIDKMDYFVDLKINAIELMPVMEFEGNDSWGYNPTYHMALDKYYGTEEKFKEFIDLCHQNGIAVILDIALNHVYGRSPLVRMWMNDPDGDGWGGPTTENPYMNTVATHSYSVGDDINHSQAISQYYVQRTVEHWIEEYKVDGFRWDLTKGFTQNCTANDEACTGAYQQDRVDILKQYADYQWAIDPDSYVIFEHLGTDAEEQQWANYKINEGKGIMTWGNMNHQYSQNTMGFSSDSNFNRVMASTRGFNEQRLVGYAESHDEERLMYRNLEFGNNANPSHNVRNLNVALSRMGALGAVLFTVPGPKMFWQMGELGYDYSINHCPDGSINNNCRLSPKPVRWDYLNVAERAAIYEDWAKIFELKTSEEVFSSNTYNVESGDLKPRVYIWDDTIPSSELKNVVVFANFANTAQTITPFFPYTGTWYNLMDDSTLEVTSTSQTYFLQPGEFRIYGNQPANLSTEDIQPFEDELYLIVAQNPVENQTAIIDYYTENASDLELQIFDVTGNLVWSQKLSEPKDRIVVPFAFKTGVYLVHLQSKNDKQTTKMFVK